jgi:hypothetical protein
MLLSGWHFGQIANTGVGWSILSLLFFLKHLTNPKWIYAIAFAAFYVIASLCSGYLVFFTPIAFFIVLIGKQLYENKLPDRRWGVQLAVAVMLSAIALAPSLLVYKKFQREHGLVRPGFSVAKFVFPSLKDAGEREEIELDENERVFRFSRTASLQILFTLVAIPLMFRKSFRADGWAFAFLLFTLFTFWMASAEVSPYRLLSTLPGFNGLRAVQRWYLFLSVGITTCTALVLAYLIRMKPVLVRSILTVGILVWAIWFIGSEREKYRLPRLRPGLQVYSFLRTQPPGPICILPLVDPEKPNWARVNSARMIYQLWHRFPMISGYSGFTPPLIALMESTLLETGISKAVTNKLARTGVRYLVIDSMLGDTSVLRRSVRSIPGLNVLYEKGDEMVVQLPPNLVEHRLYVLVRMWKLQKGK